MIRVKRIYEEPRKDDGYRILVDRLWPRGVSKERAKIDLWMKETAPSSELRKWFSHDPEKWEDLKKKYEMELKDKQELLNSIKQMEREKGMITLLYSSKEEKHNNAVVLDEVLRRS
jgi:uncharacterized protein YeaO (DUF488 family)